MRKRFLAILLACLMVVGMLPTTALAAGTAANNAVKIELVKDSTTFSGKEVLRVDFYAISGTDTPDNHMIYLKYDANKFAPLAQATGADASSYATNFSTNMSAAFTKNNYKYSDPILGDQASEVMLYTIIKDGSGYICWKVTEPSGTQAFSNYTHISSIFFGLKDGTKFDALPSNIIGYSDPKEDDSITAASSAVQITVNGGGEGNVFDYKKDDGSADTMTVTPTVNAGEGVTLVKPAYSGTVSVPTVTKNKGGAVELTAISISGETVEYGYSETNSAASVTNWQTGTTFNGLTVGSTYYFFARVTETSEHSAKASEGTEVTVNDKETPTISVVPTASTITYGQTLASSTLSGGTASTTGTFAWKTSTTAPTVSDSNVTEYEVVFTPSNTADYATATCKVKLTVNPKTITPTIADISDQEYTGSAIEPTVTVTGDGKTLVKDTDYTVDYSNNTNKGTATVTVKAKSGSNYTFSNVTKNFIIVGKAGKITFADGSYNIPYDGSAVTAGTSSADLIYTYVGDGSVTVKWYADNSGSKGSELSGGAPKDAGIYWIGVSASAGTNYGAVAEVTHSFTITPKSINGATITLGTQKFYNGSAQDVVITSVTVDGKTLTSGTDYDITSGGNATNVTNTTLTIQGKDNYDGTATTTWSLQKATPGEGDFDITTDLTKNYTGSPVAVPAPTSGKVGIGTQRTVYYEGTSGTSYTKSPTAPTNVGTYTVTFDVAGGTNYNAATGLSIGTLTITAKNASDLTVSAPDQTTVVGVGTFNDPVVTFNGTTVEGTYKYAYDSETNKSHAEVVEMLKTKSKDAEVTLTGTFTPNSTNFTGTKTFTLKVTVKDIEFKMGSEAASAANAITELTADTVYGKTWNQRISLKSGIVASVGSETKAGTYTIVPGAGALTDRPDAGTASYTVQFTSTDGTYTNVTVFTGTITVTKKDVTITGLKASDKVYNGNTTATATGTAAISGMVQGDTVTVTAGTAAFADKKVGNGKTVSFTGYTLSGAAAGNYNLTAQPASVTANITAKPVTVTVTATDRDYVSGNRNVVLVAGSVTGAVVGDTVNVDVSGATGTMENEDAGTGKAVTVTGVSLSGADAGNYNLTAQPTGVTVTINKKNYDGSITGNKNVHINQAQTGVTFDMSEKFGVIKGAAVKSASEGTDSDNLIDNVSVDGNVVKFDVASIADAGKTATINVVISCTNFNDITAVLTVKTVDKDEAGVTISGVPAEAKTYGDADLTLTASAATPGANGTWTWETSDSSVLQLTPNGNKVTVKLLKAGKATVTAKYESDTTIGQLTTANIRVEKATITVATKNQSIYVNGTVPDLTSPVKDTHYTVTGLAAGDTLGGTLTMKYQKDGVDATPDATKTGTYDIVISGATAPAGGNYNDVVFTAGTLTISNRPSSGGGGSSSGSSSSTTTVPVSNSKNEVKVTASVSSSTATVQKMDLSKIDPAQGATIDFTGLGKTIESAKLPTSAIKEIGATEGGSMTVKLTAGNVTFDTAALKAVADQAGSQITLALTPAKTSALNASQKEAVGDAPVFDLRLLGGSKAITDFKGGNVTVTLPHTLSEGQNPAGVVVYYLSNDGNPEACNTTYDAKNKLVTFTTTHFSLYFVGYEQPAAEWKNPFTDVAEGAWYYDSIKYVYSNGMMVGTGDTKFSPDTTTTRGMIVTILYRLEGEPAVSGTSSFNDVASGRWYANAVKWAAENEIVGGYGNGNFGPEDPISREQMAAILYRYAAFKGFDITKTADLSKFTDSSKISDWAKFALSWANAEGLINGKGNGILDPLGKATRAEVATILRNFCENVVK